MCSTVPKGRKRSSSVLKMPRCDSSVLKKSKADFDRKGPRCGLIVPKTNCKNRRVEMPKTWIARAKKSSGPVLALLIDQRTDSAIVNRPMCVVLQC